jgi:hypothetical protein
LSKYTEKTVVVVLGMHRSGTSAVTRGLSAFGVSLGSNLLPANDGNSKGYWEDADIVSLNEDLLSALNNSWHSLKPILLNEYDNDRVFELKKRACVLLEEKIKGEEIFGMKDPRVPKLLPFWNDVFKEVGVNVKFVIPFRHPLSVANSIATRDGFDLEKGVLLWYEHMLNSLVYSNLYPRVVVKYEALLKNPGQEFERISRVLNFKFNSDNEDFLDYVNNFLESSLQNHKHESTHNLEGNVKFLYEKLENFENDPDKNREIDELKNHLHMNSYVFYYLEKKNTENFSLKDEIDKMNTELASARLLIDQKNNFIEDVHNSKTWKLLNFLEKMFRFFKKV